MKHLNIFTILILLGLSCVQAQHHQKSVELLTLSVSDVSGTFYFRDGESIRELRVSTQGVSQPLTYQGPSQLLLYKNANQLETSTEASVPDAKVILKPNTDRQLLVFTRNKIKQGASAKIKITPLAISTQEFENGEYKIFNFSQFPVKIKIGPVAKGIAAGKEVVLKGITPKKQIQDFSVALNIVDQGEETAMYRSVWGHSPHRRVFIFILNKSDAQRPISIQMFHDQL